LNLTIELAQGNLGGLLLKNPVMTASGTFGYGMEYDHPFDIQKLGAIVCKGTTLLPREGNPQPRIAETASGMLNSIGLQNIGVDALITDKAPVWAGWDVPVIVNIAGATIDEYAEIAERLEGVRGIAALEVNISCPNVKAGGAEFGARPEMARQVTEVVRKATTLPVIMKLTPNTNAIVEIAEAVTDAGADAICLINTLKGMAIDIAGRKPVLGNIFGGLSGPAIKPVALAMIYEVTGKINIPIIGCGGIVTASDAIEFFMAGASAVEVGMANMINPSTPMDILEGIRAFMKKEGIGDIREIIGAAQKST